jgi:uncharacterized protein YdaU (DUF1376 family)
MQNSPKITFVQQGDFGCIYKPHIPCSTIESTSIWSPSYISKLQPFSTKTNEMVISEIIRTIPNYKRYFAPIESSCVLEEPQWRQHDISLCPFLRKENDYENVRKDEEQEMVPEEKENNDEEQDMVPEEKERNDGEQDMVPEEKERNDGEQDMVPEKKEEKKEKEKDSTEHVTWANMFTTNLFQENKEHTTSIQSHKIRFVGHQTFFDYLSTRSHPTIMIKRLLEGYIHLVTSLDLLQQTQITHFHLTHQHILYDELYGCPILIDFRNAWKYGTNQTTSPFVDISNFFLQEHLPLEILPSKFPIHWPFEILLIFHLRQLPPEDPFDFEAIQQLLEEFLQQNFIFQSFVPLDIISMSQDSSPSSPSMDHEFLFPSSSSYAPIQTYKESVLSYLTSQCQYDIHNHILTQNQQLIDSLVKDTFASWDIYALHVLMKEYVDSIQYILQLTSPSSFDLESYMVSSEPKEEMEDISFSSSSLLRHLHNMIHQSLFTFPKRPSPQEILSMFIK